MVCRLAGALMILAAFSRAQSVPLDVEFKLTDLEYKPLPGQPVRLVFGDAKNWQSPGAGNRFVTDANGEARYATHVAIDRRWRWQPIGFTPFSWPMRVDHLQVAAELERVVPGVVTFHLLHKMDIDRLPDGTCATSDFTVIYSPDAQGRFTQLVPTDTGMPIPNSNLRLVGSPYQTWDHMLEPKDEQKTSWHLKLAFRRAPPPVVYR